MTTTPEWEKEFDERFGTVEFSDDETRLSEGRGAGCDDCETNQKLRQEHKDFVRSLLTQHEQDVREKLVKEAQGLLKDTLEEARKGVVAAQSTAGWNLAIRKILSLLQSPTE